MVSQTIECVFADLCNKHGLTVLNVGLTHGYHDANHAWTAYVHWEGDCASGYGASASKAIADAITQANARRSPDIAVEADITLELAA